MFSGQAFGSQSFINKLLLHQEHIHTFAVLRKIISISLLSMYLLCATELHQLLKLPLLMEHFVEHKKENRDLTLWGYLCIHYAHGAVEDADHAKDMKLPFKSNEGCTDSNITAFVPNNFASEVEKPVINEPKCFPSHDETFLTSSFLSNIWQPPKSC